MFRCSSELKPLLTLLVQNVSLLQVWVQFRRLHFCLGSDSSPDVYQQVSAADSKGCPLVFLWVPEHLFEFTAGTLFMSKGA